MQQPHYLTDISPTNKFRCMPAKPLTPEQKADSDRLRSAWDSFKHENGYATQEWLADQCGWKTQGAVSQYMLGKIPLNLPALLRFSAALGFSPQTISPALASQLPDGGTVAPTQPTRAEAAGTSYAPSQALRRIAKLLQGRNEAEIERVVAALELLLKAEPQQQPEQPVFSRKKKVIEFAGLPLSAKAKKRGTK